MDGYLCQKVDKINSAYVISVTDHRGGKGIFHNMGNNCCFIKNNCSSISICFVLSDWI